MYWHSHSPFDSIPFHSTASHTQTNINKHKASPAHIIHARALSHLFVHSHLVFCEMCINGMALTMFLWLLVSSFELTFFCSVSMFGCFCFIFIFFCPFETAPLFAERFSTPDFIYDANAFYVLPFFFFLSFLHWLCLPFIC